MGRRSLALILLAAALTQPSPALGGEDDEKQYLKGDPDIPTQDLRVGKDEKKRYLLHGPRKGAKEPAGGWRIAVIAPGGSGGIDFAPFVRSVLREALTDEFLVVQPVPVKWTAEQEITWPRKLSPAPKMKFPTEEYVEDVLAEVFKARKVDRSRVFALGWSSSGPLVYDLALREKTPFTGFYVAMSVFVTGKLPPLGNAKGRAFFLDHSKQDETCKFFFAEKAVAELRKNEAVVELVTYEGGHGWQGDKFGRLKQGFEWLEKNRPKPAK